MRKGNTGFWILFIIVCYGLFFTPIGKGLLSSLGPTLQRDFPSVETSLLQSKASTSGCSYESLIRQDADTVGISEQYFLRQIIRESHCDPNAIGPYGEQGIAQFTPALARQVGLQNPFDPTSALSASAHIMAQYNSQFGDYAKALAAYNAGSGRVHAAERCGVTWLNCLNADIGSTSTSDYVNAILYGTS